MGTIGGFGRGTIKKDMLENFPELQENLYLKVI